MSPHSAMRVFYRLRFPRVSGDEPDLIGVAADLAAFSPRERG